MEEQMEVGVIAAEVDADGAALQELERRVASLEAELSELRSVAASAAGRKTIVTGMVSKESAGALDMALGNLSLEQRIAVKSGMARAGLL